MLPFHATESEKRIIGELLATAGLRGDAAAVTNHDLWLERGIDSAAKLIAFLKQQLFPHETRLSEERVRLLIPLQSNSLRAHFDQTLETAAITINVKIRTGDEYRQFIERLKGFDFDAWQRHCDSERSDAD